MGEREIPYDIRESANRVVNEYHMQDRVTGEALGSLVARVLLAERERCAQIVEHRPLAIPDRQELAAYIRSGWHSLYADNPNET